MVDRRMRGRPERERLQPRFPILAVGVGHNEHALACVCRTHGARRKHRPFRIVPERGQVAEYIAHPPVKESCNVLHEHVAGSKLANDSSELAPESGSWVVKPALSSGVADALTGKTASGDVDGGEVVGAAVADIAVSGDGGPMSFQNSCCIVVDLDLPAAAQPGPFQAEVDTADAGKEASKGEH